VFNLLAKFLESRARGLVRSFQISATFPHLTVLENVRIALQRTMDPRS
jgi:branched-chain amino acid transport system ATP-binding protein